MEEKLLSEIGKGNNWVKPEKMLVLKKKNIAYSAFYNADKQTFGPLLEATIYNDDKIPEIKDAEIVDYREVVKVK